MGFVYKTVGLLLNNGTISGVRLVDIAEPFREGAVVNLPFASLNAFLKTHYVFSNLYFDSQTKVFKLNSGEPNNLPWYDAKTLKPLKRKDGVCGMLVTISEFYKDGKTLGYAVIDGSGKVYRLDVNTYKTWLKQYKFFEESSIYKIDFDDPVKSSIKYAIDLSGHPADLKPIDNDTQSNPTSVQNTPNATQNIPTPVQNTSTTQNTPDPPKKRDLRASLNKRKEEFSEKVNTKDAPVIEDNRDSEEYTLKEGDLGLGIPVAEGIFRARGRAFVIQGVSDEEHATIMCKDLVNGSPISVASRIIRLTAIIENIRPFYGAYFSIMDKLPVSDIDTMATDGSRLFYNPIFAATISEDEMLFILLHEIYHGMMLHMARRGERDPYLFNVACDLFINKTLQEEFGLSTTYANVPETVRLNNSNSSNIKIALPENALFSADVNTDVDTPERIYAELKENMEQQQQQSAGGGDGDEESDNSEQGNGSSSGNQSGSADDEKNGSSNGQGSSQSGSSSNQNGGSAGNGAPGGADDAGQSSGSGGQSNGQSGGYGGKEITFRGKKVGTLPDKNGQGVGVGQGTGGGFDGYAPDMVQKWPADETPQMRESATRDLIERAVQIVQKKENYSNSSPDSIMGRLVADAQAPILSWRTALAHLMGHAISDTMRTFQKPDRRFISSGGYYSGKKDVKEGLDNIYICIDTSGSITDVELGIVFKQIRQLMQMPKFRKLKAKVLFWDTQVAAVQDFEGLEGYQQYIKKAKPAGGGGTDVNCVFDYVIKKNKIKGTSLSEPFVLAIFTDGCFSMPDKKYSMFKDTLWIISQQVGERFKAPWGKTVEVKSFIDS